MTTALGGPGLLASNETRIDGREKVSGRALYTADLTRAGMLWAAFVTSPHPHATIVRIQTEAARAMPGVHAVLTGRDIGEVRFGAVLADWPVLAYDRVRLVGEYVAVVAAESREQAEAAAAAIDVVYDDLAPILDTEAAIAPNAPLVHADDAQYTFAGGTRASRPPEPARLRCSGQRRSAAGFAAPLRVRADIEPRASIPATSSRARSGLD